MNSLKSWKSSKFSDIVAFGGDLKQNKISLYFAFISFPPPLPYHKDYNCYAILISCYRQLHYFIMAGGWLIFVCATLSLALRGEIISFSRIFCNCILLLFCCKCSSLGVQNFLKTRASVVVLNRCLKRLRQHSRIFSLNCTQFILLIVFRRYVGVAQYKLLTLLI